MDREILFRGKRLDNGELVEGYLIRGARSYIAASKDVGYMVVSVSGMASVQLHVVDPSTVGQYTGLTDKNGKKIFEGDIIFIREWEETTDVYWRSGSWFLRFNDSDEFLSEIAESCEIIGSVHDTPELIRGEDDE